jgi:hypothetical protein
MVQYLAAFLSQFNAVSHAGVATLHAGLPRATEYLLWRFACR